jgi:uncharacterized membrane protein
MDFTKYICHRIPERSFFIKGHQFPVCARCTGFYTGLALFLVYNFFYPIDYSLSLFIFSIILMIPAAIDGFSQLFKMRESNNTLRFLTGLLGGIGLIIFLKIVIEWCLKTL